MKKTRKYKPGPTIWAGVLLAMFGTAVEYTLYLQNMRVAQEARLEAVEFSSRLRAKVDRELNAVIHLTSGLSSYLTVRHNSLDPRELENILAALSTGSRHIRNFGIAIGYRLTYVYPRAGNETAIGLDYRELPDQWPAVRRAVDERKGILVEGIRLVQGGVGIVYRVPVYIDGNYWGLLSSVIDADSVLSAAFQNDREARYEFALKGSDGADGPGLVLWGRQELFTDPDAVLAGPDNDWHFALKRRGPNTDALMGWLVRGLGWAFALALAAMAYLILKHRESLAQIALVDPLTGLPNRRLLDDRIEQAVAQGKRHPKHQSALLFIDLDGFKAINDEHGHRAGDTVLREAAARIRRCLRVGDTVGRWGGDEFVVLVPEVGDGEVEELVQRLRAAVEMSLERDGRNYRVGASIGWALNPRDAGTAQELIRLADHAMYEDKKTRKIAG